MFGRMWSQPSAGPAGKIDVPSVGLLVGEIASWDLTRREGTDPKSGSMILRASLSHVSEWMFNDPSLAHRVVIEIGRGKQFRLQPDDDARTVLSGLSLLIEGVTLCPL